MRCERLRRGERCWCRIAAGDLAETLERSGAPELAEYFGTRLEPEDVEELAQGLRAHLPRAIGDADVHESLSRLERDLSRITEAGSGLTDEYSDDID